MCLTPTDTKLPFSFQWRQYPLVVSFTMIINKSQGQSLQTVGIYLPRHVFSHEQLYVAISRVTCQSGLKILISDDEGNSKTTTTDIVYKEIF